MARVATSLHIYRGLAFLLGFSFAFLPNFGPFVSLLFFLESRKSLLRSAWVWGGAALLLALPLLVNSVPSFGVALLQVLAPWVIYVASSQLPHVRTFRTHSRSLGYGLITGLAVIVGMGFLNIETFSFAYKTLSQAIVWQNSPALYGHTVLTLGGLIAIMSQRGRFRLVGLGLSALGILLSGSREAALAWVIITFVLLLAEKTSVRSRLIQFVFSLAMVAISIGLGPRIGWGNMGFLLDIVPGTSTNLIQGSEIGNGDWWDTTWVDVTTEPVTLGGNELTAYNVTKKDPTPWYRLQQIVPIQKDVSYTLSVWLRSNEMINGKRLVPGLQGHGRIDENQSFAVFGEWKNGTWRASSTGAGRVLSSGIIAAEGIWRRVYVTFAYQGEAPQLYLHVGFAPDQREWAGSTAQFAGLQLEATTAPSPYTPGIATRGLTLGVARIPYWQVAMQGIREQPWLGHGEGTFPEYYRAHADRIGQLQEVPSHIHNHYLQILFERGILGFLGLVLFIVAVSYGALQRRDVAFLAVLAGVLFMNVFDNSLFYGGVLYPLAAVAGWRSRAYKTQRQESTNRPVLTRLALAFTDTGLVFVSLLLSRQIFMWLGGQSLPIPTTLTYALLLWPAMCWREGLYPGYGLTAAQELRKHVTAAFYAAIILAAGTVLFARDLGLPRPIILGMIVTNFFLLPIGRALCKRVLHNSGLWGKQVIVLGAGRIGERVIKTLRNTPLQGLQPVAVFDDDDKKQETLVSGVPVLGKLAQADDVARDRAINHAIVAIPSLPTEVLADFVNKRSRNFSIVQFVPDLVSLPSEVVFTSNLTGMLALEVHNQLALPMNRVVKRLLDIVAVTLGGFILSPILLLIALAVYFDSPGPIFFGHKRIGRDGKFFKAWKFRTMVPNAQEKLEEYLKANPELETEWRETQKLQHDPRITRIGKFLRKYSLDELPQLWNVFIGEMSLVGPRPIVEAEAEKYGKDFMLYTMVRPGITGYWQTSGRSDTDYDERVALDSFYVRNWSVWLDIIILVKTPAVVLGGEGAY
ncbi:MAG: undecaprenyl-phosphate galactose phosphotransferase WbaP [Trueperaceae bacterium]